MKKSNKKNVIKHSEIQQCKSQYAQVKLAVTKITKKLSQLDPLHLHPPFFPKSLTKYRRQYYMPLKNQLKLHQLKEGSQVKQKLKILQSFIEQLDTKNIDIYEEQLRQPYIRKIFNENYQFNKLNFKEIKRDYDLSAEVEQLLLCASEWFIKIEETQDLLSRLQLYFDFKSVNIDHIMKKQGIEHKGTFLFRIGSMIKTLSSFGLKSASSAIKVKSYTLISLFVLLSVVMIDGGFFDAKQLTNLIVPLLSLMVPSILNRMADNIERGKFQNILGEWCQTFNSISESIEKFNELLESGIRQTVQSNSWEDYHKNIINLEKYTQNLSKNLDKATSYDERTFEEMKQRTEAYFKPYIEVEEEGWTLILDEKEYETYLKQVYEQELLEQQQYQVLE